MLQNPCKTLGFKKNMVYKIPPGGGGGKPYPASGLTSKPIISRMGLKFSRIQLGAYELPALERLEKIPIDF